jgi:hypothetical protein
MKLPGFTANLSLLRMERRMAAPTLRWSDTPGVRPQLSGLARQRSPASANHADMDVLCVPWYCCEEGAGCGWNCHICVVILGSTLK